MGYNVAVGAVTYNWLIDNGSGALVHGGAVQVSTPSFTYYPPVAGNPTYYPPVAGNPAPPQVQAVIVPPPPAPPPKEFGDAVWVKEIRTTAHNDHEVKLRDLVSADPANAGFRFVNWTENGLIVSNDPDYAFTADTNHALVAHFAAAVTLDASASPDPEGTVSGNGSYGLGAVASLLAAPNAGYTFVNWSEGGKVVSSSANYHFTVTSARALVANFTQSFTIDATVATGAGGTLSGTGSYADGSAVTLTAIADPGYAFANWTEAGVVVSTTATYSFTAGGPRTLEANFALIIPRISLTATAPGTQTLAWPADLPGWTLEQCQDLNSGNWLDSTWPITVTNGQNQVQIDTTGGSLFLRLKHP